jgi:hypothetical protein
MPATKHPAIQAAELRAKAMNMRPIAEGYLALKLIADDLRIEVDKIAARLLATECPLFDEEGERILKNQLTYTAIDEGALNAFYAAMNRELRAADIKPADMGDEYCPALVARSAFIDAQCAIINTLAPLVDINPERLWGDKRDQFLELALGLILNA